jgi:AsmA protein
VELAAGNASAVTASLASRPLQLGFTGKASSIFDLRAEGAFEASTPDLALVARAFAHGWGDLVRPVKASIAGQASLNARSIGVANARLQTGAVPLQGALTLRFRAGGRPTLAGTLAAEALDLRPALAHLVPASIREGGWTRQPFAVSVLNEGDLDLRLSASKATLGGHAFDHFACGLMVANGRLDLTASSGAPGSAGQFRGRLIAQAGASGLETRMQLSGEGLDLASFLGEGLELRRLSGRGNVAATLEGRGLNPAGLARSLRGQAALIGAKGEIIGIDLPAVLRRVERSPLAFAGERAAGRTPFEGLKFEGRVLDGVLQLDQGSVDGGSSRIRLTGSVDLAERTLALAGEASAQRPARGGQAGTPLPFEVRGSWDDPLIAPDIKALIRRSGAAAPFLEAITPPSVSVAAPSATPASDGR